MSTFSFKTWPFLQSLYFSYPKRWQRCALPRSEKVPIRVVFCSSVSVPQFWSNLPQPFHTDVWRYSCLNPCGRQQTASVGWTTEDPYIYESRHDKTCLREFPTRPDTNRPAQPQKLSRVLKFQLYNLEILYCLSSEQQRRWSDCADAQADLRLCRSHMK